jgi:hypothetical protein
MSNIKCKCYYCCYCYCCCYYYYYCYFYYYYIIRKIVIIVLKLFPDLIYFFSQHNENLFIILITK